MIKRILLSVIFLVSIATHGYTQDVFNYHRSSLYSVLLVHENKPFAKEIENAFKSIPIPEKFNDHNLSRQVFKAAVLQDEDDEESDGNGQKLHIDEILSKNGIGKRLVSKWYNRDKQGVFNCDLLVSRGYYDANAFEVAIADRTIVGRSNLVRDAGVELISNTYVVVHDIQYYDKKKTKKGLTNAVEALTVLASIVPGYSIVGSTVGTIANGALANVSERVLGFKVFVTSYLYRLDWNEEEEALFYKSYYTTKEDAQRKEAYRKDRDHFKLTYLGKQTVYSNKTTVCGVDKEEDIFVKVCTRAMDEAIAQLQKDNEEFRIRTPLLSTEPITAEIGVKEGVTEESKFEVLEVSQEDGLTKYKRVAILKPKKGFVWDNRYLAETEEDNRMSLLKHTEFEKVSGGDLYPGMLVREIIE